MELFLYCNQCKKVYANSTWLKHNDSCPTENCRGNKLENAFDWQSLRKVYYPIIPEEGKIYEI